MPIFLILLNIRSVISAFSETATRAVRTSCIRVALGLDILVRPARLRKQAPIIYRNLDLHRRPRVVAGRYAELAPVHIDNRVGPGKPDAEARI